MLQDLAELLGGNPEESEILDIIEFEHKLTNISVPRYENRVCTLSMNQHSLQDPNARFGGTLQRHDNTRTKKVSTYSTVGAIKCFQQLVGHKVTTKRKRQYDLEVHKIRKLAFFDWLKMIWI